MRAPSRFPSHARGSTLCHPPAGTTDWKLLYDPAYGNLFIPLRETAAVVGSILVVVTFLSARAIGCGRITASLAAWLILCETVIALQSRLILCDAFLYLFNMASIGASFAAANPRLSRRSQLYACLAVGLLLGCALSVKLTALGTVAVVGVHQALYLATELGAVKPPGSLLPMLASAAVLFFGLWVVHIEILPYSGQGDGFSIPEFSRTLVQKTLPGTLPPAAPADPMACPNPANVWSDCGWAGITPEGCEAKGCCWDPTSTRAWCYHKGTLAKPTMGMVAKIREVIRASIANNHGGAVMIHPFMSEWREWPLLTGKSVPFATSRRGGQLKAIGNPGVWWQATGFFAVSLCVGLLWFAAHGYALGCAGMAWFDDHVREALRAGVAAPSAAGGKGAKAAAAAVGGARKPALHAAEEGAAASAAVSPASAPSCDGRPTPFWIAFCTLWVGYLANLVPYELITRSKFIYHGVPCIMVGVLLVSVSLEYAAHWANVSGGGGTARRVPVALLTAASFAAAGLGFWYWGLPYVYGYPLTHEQNEARRWNPNW